MRTGASAYVVFGTSTALAVDLAAFGTDGVRMDVAATTDTVTAVAGIGDVNGDGRGDVIVGVLRPLAVPFHAGMAYVVFGRQAGSIDLGALGTGGYRIDGTQNDSLAFAVAGAGDVNGDGRKDVIVGAPRANYNDGSAYVVFGQAAASNIDLSTLGARGFRIDGAADGGPPPMAGFSVAGAGDVNGDGRSDVIVGAPRAGNNGWYSGSAYVVFGRTATTSVDLGALGANGFRLDGNHVHAEAGFSVAGAGDHNGDGRADVIVGSHEEAFGSTASGFCLRRLRPRGGHRGASGQLGIGRISHVRQRRPVRPHRQLRRASR